MSDKLNLELVDNALDFILKSLDSIDTTESKDLKYTALHIFPGVLLILKERLRIIDWKLLFQNESKADKNKFKTGDFQSVNFDTLLKRLEENSVIIDNEFKNELKWLRNERNKIEHFAVNISVDALKSHIVKLFIHLSPFIQSELIDESLLNHDDERILKLNGFLFSFQEYIDKKIQLIQEVGLDDAIIPDINCPNCAQSTIEIHENEAHCHFCHTKYDNFEDEYISTNYCLHEIITTGGEDPRTECLECGEYSLIYINKKFICLQCGQNYKQENLKACDYGRCGGNLVYVSYTGDEEPWDELVICYDCLEHVNSL